MLVVHSVVVETILFSNLCFPRLRHCLSRLSQHHQTSKKKTPPTSQLGSTAPSLDAIRPSNTRVEWIPVDEVKQQLFNIPPGVNFMPVLVAADQERSIREGERLASLRSRLPLQRVSFVF
ncbi:hypothetical protein COOONC_03067 [Cooperia oncophora]